MCDLQTQSGWKLTCERLRTLKAKRQAEMEDLPTEVSNQTAVPPEFEEGRSRANPNQLPTDFPEQENRMETTSAPTQTTETSLTSVSPDRFQVLEQVRDFEFYFSAFQ